MNWALPYIQKGLDYLLNNGEQVAHIIGILAATFAGMKLAPAAEGLLSGVGGMLFGGNAAGGGKRSGGLFGSIKSLFMGGRKAGSAGAGFASAFGGAVSGNGFKATMELRCQACWPETALRGQRACSLPQLGRRGFSPAMLGREA